MVSLEIKGIVSGVNVFIWSMDAKHEVSASWHSKVIAYVKVDNRQTDRHAKRQIGKSDVLRSVDSWA